MARVYIFLAAMFSVVSFGQSGQSRRVSPNPAPAAHTKKTTPVISESALTISSLKVDGLRNKAAIMALYSGDFDSVVRPIRKLLNFYPFYTSFLEGYAVTCPDQFPSNRVPLTTYSCALEKQPVDQYGRPVAQSYCAQEYRQPIPGEFAYPRDEQTQIALEDAIQSQGIAEALADKEHPIDGIKEAVAEGDYAAADWKVLFAANGCTNPAVNRLRVNMGLFGTGHDSLKLGEDEESEFLYRRANLCWIKHRTFVKSGYGNDGLPYLPQDCYDDLKRYLVLSPNGSKAHEVRQLIGSVRPGVCQGAGCEE